jgi:Gas vesicle protein
LVRCALPLCPARAGDCSPSIPRNPSLVASSSIAGDIKIKLVDIELLTIQIRLVVASVEKAREMGLDWWTTNADLRGRPAAIAHLAWPDPSAVIPSRDDGEQGVRDGLPDHRDPSSRRGGATAIASVDPSGASR